MVLKANKKRQGRDVLGAITWDEAVSFSIQMTVPEACCGEEAIMLSLHESI
jgi:hypothetical protein